MLNYIIQNDNRPLRYYTFTIYIYTDTVLIKHLRISSIYIVNF